MLLPLPLPIRLSGVIPLMHNQILRLVVLAPTEILLQNRLGAGGVALLRVDGGAGHVGHHGVPATPRGVGGVAERVVLGGGLREPDVAAVAAELAALEGLGHVFLDDDGAAGRVDEPGAWWS